MATLLLAAAPMFAHAEIYKCHLADGSLRISDEPCNLSAGTAHATSSSNKPPATGMKPSAGQKASTAGCVAPISAAENPMLKLSTDEQEIARFSLGPGEMREISFSSFNRQNVMYRVAFNEGMRCKYENGPVGMSTDGRTWMHSYYGGQGLAPANGKISLMLKNTGEEVVNVLVVTTGSR